jgi:hypothetical protein
MQTDGEQQQDEADLGQLVGQRLKPGVKGPIRMPASRSGGRCAAGSPRDRTRKPGRGLLRSLRAPSRAR